MGLNKYRELVVARIHQASSRWFMLTKQFLRSDVSQSFSGLSSPAETCRPSAEGRQITCNLLHI